MRSELPWRRLTRCDGFSLIELLVALVVSTTVTLLACMLVVGAQSAWRVASAQSDVQHRARALGDTLSRALLESGGGPYSGIARGPLLRAIAPVLPRRIGRRGAHAATAFRRDAFTVIRTVGEATPLTLLTAAAAGTGTLEVSPGSGCATAACELGEGSAVLVLDLAGGFDIFTVTAVTGAVLSVRPHGTGSGRGYAAGSPVLAVETASYFVDAATSTLREYDGDASDVPIGDDVVGMDVRYFGTVYPPALPRPVPGQSNCLYAADGSYNGVLMPMLAGIGALTELSADILTDGPWCGSGDTQFDADLLRVRRVRLVIRLQASDPAVRGRDRSRFSHPGTARTDSSAVPDLVLSVDVTPRNLLQ